MHIIIIAYYNYCILLYYYYTLIIIQLYALYTYFVYETIVERIEL